MIYPLDIAARVDRLERLERARGIGSRVFEIAAVESSNRRLVEMGWEGAGHGTVLVAADQTAGSGKGDRSWFSTKDGSLCLSVLVETGRPLAETAQLTLLAGVAMREAIALATGVEAGIKWPNDLLVGGRKICGILAEAACDEEGELAFAVVGLGLNLSIRPSEFPTQLQSTATSLAALPGRPVTRDDLIGVFLDVFDRWFELWRRSGLAAFAATWTEHALDVGRIVRLAEDDQETRARLIGLADDGALRVRGPDGALRDVHSGEIVTAPAADRRPSQFSKTHMGVLS